MEQQVTSKDKIKFIIMSLIGVFLFMVPLPNANGDFNIPLGHLLAALGRALNSVEVNDFGLIYLLACIIISFSFLSSCLAYILKPGFITENEKLRNLFLSSPVYMISKAVGFVICWLVFFGIGPDWLIGWGGGRLMMNLISSNTGLVAIFLVVGIAIPLLTDFGLMEFLGILIRKGVRVLFTLPGRSSVDLLGSWFSSSAASVMITRDQHEKGYYTDREASAICVNFTLVSLPFTFVVASAIGMEAHFFLFYIIITITAILLAVIMPRIWPLCRLKDEYLPEIGKQLDEEVPENAPVIKWAVNLAGSRASKTGPRDVLNTGASNWLNIFMDLIPVILAWGTIALIIESSTPVFDWLSWPFGWYLQLLRVDGAFAYAPATIVGFIDMYLPAILLGTDAPFETRFILGALSIVQIIYLAETGILILKSKMSLNIGHLAVIFLMRTIFALPVIVLLTRVIVM